MTWLRWPLFGGERGQVAGLMDFSRKENDHDGYTPILDKAIGERDSPTAHDVVQDRFSHKMIVPSHVPVCHRALLQKPLRTGSVIGRSRRAASDNAKASSHGAGGCLLWRCSTSRFSRISNTSGCMGWNGSIADAFPARALQRRRPVGRAGLVFLPRQASRSMIHSTSGAATKRHLRKGPAITLR